MQMIKLLQTPELKNIKLIAGDQGIDRDAKLIGMIEAPDIESYLFQGQLLVTTGYHYYKHVDRLKTLIQKMAAKGCAGLGIKANRYFKKIPADILTLANQLKFPLLLTPEEEPLSKTVSSLIQVVTQSNALKLSRVIEQNQSLSQSAFNNTKFNVVLDQCATYLRHDIVLLDSHFRVCYSNQGIWSQREPISEDLRQQSSVNYLALTDEVTVNCMNRQLRISPLMVMYPENKSFLGIFDLDTTNSMQQLQLQQIQNVLSLMNSRTDVRKEDERHQHDQFFANVLSGNIRGDLTTEMPNHLKVGLGENYYCAVAGITPAKSGIITFLNQTDQIRRYCEWFIDEYNIDATVFTERQKIVLIIRATQNPDHFVKVLANFLQRQIGERYILQIGLSNTQLPIDQLPSIYQDAQQAYTLAKQSNQAVQRFRPKEVSELLQLIPRNESTAFINETLGPILEMKNKQEMIDLLKTLRLYFYHHQQISTVSQQLFIHRNTVVYRLKKAKNLLHIDLKSPEASHRLFIALMLMPDTFE